ncbi:MAG: sulfotransferase family 2 domain-containing protein [Alphaproteobacteria bacterium]
MEFPPQFDNLRAIFVHIPKTGGLSVLSGLFGIDRLQGHIPALAYRYKSKEKFEDYFKFCVVRNPWDRCVSAFHFLKAGGVSDDDRLWADRVLGDCPDFATFAKKLESPRFAATVMAWRHFRPQADFVTDVRGRLLVDHVARFENLGAEFEMLAERLGVTARLPKINVQEGAGSYADRYTASSRATIGRLFDRDITLFEYGAVSG